MDILIAAPSTFDSANVPAEWELSTVGREFEIQLGKMLDAAKNRGILKPYVGNWAVQWGHIDTDNLPMIPMSHFDIERYRLIDGDLLVCEGGEVGRSAVWKADADINECYYQKALHRLRPVRGFDPHLMMEYLRLWSMTGSLVNYVSQTSIAHLTREKLALVPMMVPPPSEQRAIATALSDVDALIAALDRLIAKKRAVKQGAMQRLLTGEVRLEGFGGEWEERKLGDIAEVIMGQSPSSAHYNIEGKGLPLIQGAADMDRRVTIRRVYTTEITKIGRLGDVILSVRAPVGQVARATFDLCLGRGVCAIRHDSDFMFHYLINQESHWIKLSKGSTFDSVTSSDVRQLEVRVPRETIEQAAIATVLSDMDAEIAALERRRDKTRALKQGMMQELLTGRIRLV